MKRTNKLHIFLEVITIFSYIVIGTTVLTFVNQGVEPNKSYIGSIILAIGVTQVVEFLSLKDLIKLKNIPNAVLSGLYMILGIVLLAITADLSTVCVIWGICTIVFMVIKITNAGFNILRQPFLNSFIIILCVTETIFAIILLARNIVALQHHLPFIGISLLVEAFLLLVEFIIHRYQK